MSNYSKTTDFEAKDSLPTGDSGKIIRGAEFETEFDAISTAIATKADTAGPTFTGTLTFETISDGTIGVTAFVDEDDMSSDSATLVPTQQSVKAYVDSQVTAQDLDFQADTGGALSIDLDSETMTFTGGTGIDTSGSGNAVTFAIDSTVATLTGTQTLTNKTLTSPDVNTPDIDGGTIDGTVIGGTTPAAVSATTVSATGNITVGGTVDGRDVATDGTKLDGIEAGATADQTAAEIRTLVEAATDSNVFTDADHSKLDGIEAGATGDQTNAEIRAAVEAATDSNVFTDADHSKLDGIEALADVTDTTNVTAAGALMDSELTNITAVKALDQGVATTDSPTFAGLATSANVTFGDNDKAVFGDGFDLEIFHSGSHSIIRDNGTGDLRLEGSNDIFLRSVAGEVYARFRENLGAELYYDNNQKFATTSTGIDVTGVITTDGMTTSADINFGDNNKAIFGSGNDLQIYHSGSHSFISEAGTGDLYIGASSNIALMNSAFSENKLLATTDGALKLYYDGSQKLATTSTGIDITGTVTADGISSSGDITITESTPSISFVDSDGTNQIGKLRQVGDTVILSARNNTAYGNFKFTGEDGSTEKTRLQINGSTGDISFYEDTGTTAKLFWDASAESLGIGNSSPTTTLDVTGVVKAAGTVLSTSAALVNSTSAGGFGFASNNTAFYSFGADASTAGSYTFQNLSNDASINITAMKIDASGNVGIGTSSPNSNGGANATVCHIHSSNAGAWAVNHYTNGTTGAQTSDGFLAGIVASDAYLYNYESGNIIFGTSNAEKMRIDSSGNVGIGTSSPSQLLNIEGATNPAVLITDTTNTTSLLLRSQNNTSSVGTSSNHPLVLETNGAEAMRIDSSGNVGINTSSPSRKFHVDASGVTALFGNTEANNSIELTRTTSSASYVSLAANSSTAGIVAGPTFTFSTANSGGGAVNERMRIDSSGNLLVGKTSNTISAAGAKLGTSGSNFTRDSDEVVYVNRTTNDGSLITLAKDGTTVGSIGVDYGDNLFISGNSTHVGLMFDSAHIWPYKNGNFVDATVDLGVSSGRFKNLYLSGASYNGDGSAAAPSISFGADTNTGFYRVGSDQIGFVTGGSLKAKLDASGILLVGQTSGVGIGGTPADVNGTEIGPGYINLNRDDTASATQIQFGKNGSVAGSIVTTTSTTYNTTSDRRAKENIADADDAGAIVDSIQVRKFDWKDDGTHQRYGMIAQELLESAPEVVHQPENADDMMGVDYSKLVPMLVKEIQSLRARVAQLEGEN